MPAKRRPLQTTARPAGGAVRKQAAVAQGQQRLQRVLAAAGFGSRRQCEELIAEGRVAVDGKTVDKLGTTVDPKSAKIAVDGQSIKPERLVYFAVNKPVGFVTTNFDPEGRPRVIDLVPPKERVFPVGRLDRSSEGLILLTNDGELAQRLAHPKFGVQKVYRVLVAGRVEAATMQQMRQGVHIAEGLVRVEGARVLRTRGKATEMEITLKEGKNREIRRILARLGHKVQQLQRIAIGTLRLGDVPPGSYRELRREEVTKLQVSTTELERAAAKAAAAQSADPGDAGAAEKPRRRPSRSATGKPVASTRAKVKSPVKKPPRVKPGRVDAGDAVVSAAVPKPARDGVPLPKGSRRDRQIDLRNIPGPGAEPSTASRIGSVIGADEPATQDPGKSGKSRGGKTAGRRPAASAKTSDRGTAASRRAEAARIAATSSNRVAGQSSPEGASPAGKPVKKAAKKVARKRADRPDPKRAADPRSKRSGRD